MVIENHFRTFLQVAIFSMIFIKTIFAEETSTNISGRSKPQKTFDVFAEAFYWYTSEAVDWAFTLQQDQNSLKTSYKTFVFEWAPGFHVGLGGKLHNQWETQVSYAWFQSKAKDHTNGSVTPAFLAARLSLLEPFSTGRASLNVLYNMFNWDLGRFFFVCKCLSLRPSIGLMGGWITQTIHSYWTTPNLLGSFFLNASENLKQIFLGGGPKGGVILKWYFRNTQNHDFSLISQFETCYLWGHWSIRDKFVDNLSSVIRVKTTDRNFGSFILRGFIGFGWDCNYYDRMHFGFQFGYKFEDWFNQCQIFTDSSGAQNNDLIFQGLNLGLNFDF